MSLRLESLTPFFSHLPQIHCSDTYAKILNNKWPSHNKIKEFEHWSLLQTPINMDRVCVRPRPKKNPKLCVRTRFALLLKRRKLRFAFRVKHLYINYQNISCIECMYGAFLLFMNYSSHFPAQKGKWFKCEYLSWSTNYQKIKNMEREKQVILQKKMLSIVS